MKYTLRPKGEKYHEMDDEQKQKLGPTDRKPISSLME